MSERKEHNDPNEWKTLAALRTHAAAGPTPAGAQLAYDLSLLSYSEQTEPFARSGWVDIHRIKNGRILDTAPDMRRAMAVTRQIKQAYLSTKDNAAAALALPFLQQSLQTEYGKAVVLAKKLDAGEWAVAIAFAGTGKQFADWLPNMQFSHPSGFHRGFLGIAEAFIRQHDKLSFPAVAQDLGLDALTLRDILDRCKLPDSPFRIFVAGHSQGAAAAQIWMHRMMENGVPLAAMTGYGFAAPRVLTGQAPLMQPPLMLINHEQDVVPRIGMARHLGQTYVFPADRALQSACYPPLDEPLFMRYLADADAVRGTQDLLLRLTAFVSLLCYLNLENNGALDLPAFLDGLSSLHVRPLPLMRRLLADCYEDAVGAPPPWPALKPHILRYWADIRAHGVKPVTAALKASLFLPHHLSSRHNAESAYHYIVTQGLDRLQKR